MSLINEESVKRLENNTKCTYIDGLEILIKLLVNVINFPKDHKFKKIRKENKTIMEKLLVLKGIKELLIDIGFVETVTDFVLPDNIIIDKLKRYHLFIVERLNLVKSSPSSSTGNASVEPKTGAVQKIIKTESKQKTPVQTKIVRVSKSFRDRVNFPSVISSKNTFLKELEVFSNMTMQYEDPLLQESALKIIPLEKLKLQAMEKMRKIQKLVKSGKIPADPVFDDLLLDEVTTWFKNDFFTWVNSKPCKICQNEKTRPVGTSVNNGVRVEKYLCCNTISEFYRYNDVQKLMQTRQGRCGEFANCFTFICRCLGFDTRYVYSTSDHVWTEVYSHHKKRWVHVDPSENVIDSPLMYEHGWNRNLSYVLAFSKDDVQDVTWRYSNKHDEVLKRRTMCTEKELVKTICELRKKRQSLSSAARKKFLVIRTLNELVELMVIREPTEDEKKGRSSGSIAWRLERGEKEENNFYVFNALREEIKQKQFNLRYNCSKDVYERYLQGTFSVLETKKEWSALVYLSENVFRKEEHDWKMVYLARVEGSEHAKIQWKFDFSRESLKIKNIETIIETHKYENGQITVQYLNEKEEVLASKNDLRGLSKFSILLKLSGGVGDCNWQHTQLFRQPKSATNYPFQINLTFQ